jgi:hypothetical protein
VNFTGKHRLATAVNGSVPGPTLRWREGETVTLAVTNRLKEMASIHWHAIRLPSGMDGVPGLSFQPGLFLEPAMAVIPVGTILHHLDLQALHRVRDRFMARRTSLINQIRAFLLELGIVFAKTPIRLREALPEVLENANENLTPRMRNLIAMLWSEWKDLELQIVQMNEEVERLASSDAACLRLRQIPGIGHLVATAIVASIGNGAAFHKGREFAAWMGLVPKQYSTGGKTKLYGISKRGNRYLRKILIHGARAVVLRSKRDRIAMGAWMTSLETRAPRNVLIVATANKLARIAWAVLSKGHEYRAMPDAMTV